MEEKELKPGQQKAYDILMSGRNVYLTGAAGTGKTFVLNKYLNDMTESGKKIIVTATTGIAATLLGGVTFHRAFGYNTDIIDPNNTHKMLEISNNLLYADIIVIDEISMMRRDVWDLFCKQRKIVLKRRQELIENKVEDINPNIQVIVVGDFTQLKPVYQSSSKSNKKIKVLDNGKIKEYIDKYYCQKFYNNFNNGYCFSSDYWKDMNFIKVELTEIIRTEDMKFKEIMTRLRKGDVSAVEELNRIIGRTRELSSSAITLCATNKEANDINNYFLNMIESEQYRFDEKVEIYDEELRNKYNKYKYGETEEDPLSADRLGVKTLILKIGARVMCLVNEQNHLYENGSMGYVEEINGKTVKVILDSGREVDITSFKQPIYTYDTTKSKVDKIPIAEIEQIPLKVAYAVTVHKSQGQTFDNVIIKPDSFFDEGHIIVAVSRCTSLEGMKLTSDLSLKRVDKYGNIRDIPLVVPEVLEFNRKMEEGN